MTREQYIKREIKRIRDGGTIAERCVMATAERVAIGLCRGDVPEERARRGKSITCSAECQADRRRLMRWEQAKGKCRHCGHNIPKKDKLELVAKRAAVMALRAAHIKPEVMDGTLQVV